MHISHNLSTKDSRIYSQQENGRLRLKFGFIASLIKKTKYCVTIIFFSNNFYCSIRSLDIICCYVQFLALTNYPKKYPYIFFFHFHTVLVKLGHRNRLTPIFVVGALFWEILDPPLSYSTYRHGLCRTPMSRPQGHGKSHFPATTFRHSVIIHVRDTTRSTVTEALNKYHALRPRTRLSLFAPRQTEMVTSFKLSKWANILSCVVSSKKYTFLCVFFAFVGDLI